MRFKKVVFPAFSAVTIGLSLAAYGCHGQATAQIGGVASVDPTPPPPPAPSPEPPPPAPPVVKPAPPKISLKGVSGIHGSRLALTGDIEFGSGSATIKQSPQSISVINAVHDILASNMNINVLRVEGHTDNQGAAAGNLQLSLARANAVVAALVAKGIDKARLHASGLGSACPLKPNDNAADMALNRRTEFHLEKLDGAPVAADVVDANGCSKGEGENAAP
jgi:outer membrane protein OmpA-like peptidoglycan-associated protein